MKDPDEAPAWESRANVQWVTFELTPYSKDLEWAVRKWCIQNKVQVRPKSSLDEFVRLSLAEEHEQMLFKLEFSEYITDSWDFV